MADTTADQGGMKKTLSLWNFFTIGFGAIIGTGWVLQVGDWMVVGGGPVPAMIAFLIGAIFLVPIGAVFGELTAAIPISGGIVEYVDRTFGRVPSYITGWFLALGNGILCPWEAIAISTLLSDMFGTIPGLEWLRAFELYEILGAKVYLFPTLISLGFAAYVIFLNFRGASSAACCWPWASPSSPVPRRTPLPTARSSPRSPVLAAVSRRRVPTTSLAVSSPSCC